MQINEADLKIMKTKRQVVKWMSAQVRKEERSTLTDLSSNSAKSKSSLGKRSKFKRNIEADNETVMIDHIR